MFHDGFQDDNLINWGGMDTYIELRIGQCMVDAWSSKTVMFQAGLVSPLDHPCPTPINNWDRIARRRTNRDTIIHHPASCSHWGTQQSFVDHMSAISTTQRNTRKNATTQWCKEPQTHHFESSEVTQTKNNHSVLNIKILCKINQIQLCNQHEPQEQDQKKNKVILDRTTNHETATTLDGCLFLHKLQFIGQTLNLMHQGRKCSSNLSYYGKLRYNCDGLQANCTTIVMKFKLKGMFA